MARNRRRSIMTKVLLLQGPDGNRYKATEISDNTWNVVPFLNFNENLISQWWRNQCGFGCWYWNRTKDYKTSQLNEIFNILAKTETHYEPSREVIHDAF